MMSPGQRTLRRPKVEQNNCISKIFSSMTKVHEVNRQHDHELNVRVEELRQKEHLESVKRYSDMRVLQRNLSEMRMEKKRLTHTFTPEEINNDEVAPVMSWRKIQMKRFQNQPRIKQRRKLAAAKPVETVAEKSEFTAKNKFRSAIMAVCLSKALAKIPDSGRKSNDKGNESSNVDETDSIKKSGDSVEQEKGRNFQMKQSWGKKECVSHTNIQYKTNTSEESKPVTEKDQLSRVLDILKSSSRDKSRTSWTGSPVKKANAVPTFGQLHPARRPSVARRPGDPRRRRPSTSDMNFDSSHFVMDSDGTVRRISRPTMNSNSVCEQNRRELRTRSSSNPGSRTASTCKVYATEPLRLNGLDQASSNRNGAVSSSQLRKRGELLKKDSEMMNRLRTFLDSSMP